MAVVDCISTQSRLLEAWNISELSKKKKEKKEKEKKRENKKTTKGIAKYAISNTL